MQHRQLLAYRAFRSYLRLQARRGLPVEKMLNRLIKEWLTQDHIRRRFEIDGESPHEVVSLIKFIESNVRKPWIKKAQESREATRERNKINENKSRQLSFRL